MSYQKPETWAGVFVNTNVAAPQSFETGLVFGGTNIIKHFSSNSFALESASYPCASLVGELLSH